MGLNTQMVCSRLQGVHACLTIPGGSATAAWTRQGRSVRRLWRIFGAVKLATAAGGFFLFVILLSMFDVYSFFFVLLGKLMVGLDPHDMLNPNNGMKASSFWGTLCGECHDRFKRCTFAASFLCKPVCGSRTPTQSRQLATVEIRLGNTLQVTART